jgi:hypothetical protein
LPEIDYADISQREQLAAAIKRGRYWLNLLINNKEAIDGCIGVTGVRGGVGTTSITAALAGHYSF